jgi:hypothetical protein
MSPRTRLVTANVLMVIGIVPLGFFVVWLAGLVAWMRGYGTPIIPIMDPLGMIGPFALSFILTFAVAGTAAAWSWDLVRTHPHMRSRVALGLRLTTAAVLLGPFLLLFLMRFV